MLPFALPRSLATLLAVSAALVLPTARAAAQQVVVTDVTYEHSAETTSDSHYRLAALPGTPANLRAPIDYASGQAYVRLEVFTKPTDAATRFQVCFEASPTYACTDQAPAYTTTGAYTWGTPFSRFYQGDQVDWSRGLGRVALILKDTMNRKPAPENVGEEVSRRYMPTRVRVTVTLVAPGATYVPPDATGTDAGAGELDAGAGAADAGTAIDAGTPIDAGTAIDAEPAPLDAGPPTDDADAAPTPHDAGPTPLDAAPPADTSPPDRSGIVGGCSATHAHGARSALALVLAAMLWARARRRR